MPTWGLAISMNSPQMMTGRVNTRHVRAALTKRHATTMTPRRLKTIRATSLGNLVTTWKTSRKTMSFSPIALVKATVATMRKHAITAPWGARRQFVLLLRHAHEITGNAEPYSQTLQVYTYTATAGSTYEWTVVGGDILEEMAPMKSASSGMLAGLVQFGVTETNSEGCSGDEVCFIVDVSLSSVSEMLDGTLEVFPIPAVDALQVIWSGPTLDNAFVTLRDASGRVVLSKQVVQRDVVDVAGLSAGAYMLEFTVPARGSIQRRIMIQ